MAAVAIPETIPGVLRSVAARHPSGVAIEGEGAALTFSELSSVVDKAAAAFVAAGIQRGDRVAIWAPNYAEWIILALGAQAAGAVLVPLNTRFKATEAGYVLRASRARILCTVRDFLGVDYVDMLAKEYGGPVDSRPFRGLESLERVVVLRGAPDDEASFERFVAEGAAVLPEAIRARAAAVEPGDLSDILFTSGTTGDPKGVMTTHAQNVRAFSSWAEVTGLCQGDRYLIVNPFFHAFGYKAGWLACLLTGATILPHAVFDVGKVLARIATDRVTVLPGPPALYQSLLAHPELTKFDLSGLRLAVTGAASIPVELVRRMKTELGFATVITGYGLTEACGIVTMCRFDDELETIATTSGRAIPGVEVRVVREGGSDAETGQPGEVIVRGYNVMRGYFEDEARTRETIDAAGFLHTGDIGVLDAAGNLRITDRKNDMFIVGGFNCYPAEIENRLASHPAISQVAVVSAPDPRLGEVGVAFVVLRPGATATNDELVQWSRTQMANYKVPRAFELVAALPINAGGKIMKHVLRDQVRRRALASKVD